MAQNQQQQFELVNNNQLTSVLPQTHGDLTSLVDKLERQLMREQNNGYVHDEIGKAYFELNQSDKSYYHLKKAYEMKCTDYYSLYIIALLYEQRNQLGKAIYHLIEVINSEPSFYKAYNKLGEIYLTKNEYEKALQYLNEGLKRNSNDYEILNNLGLCYFNMKEYDLAIDCFSQSIRENYEYVRALNNLGNTLRKKKLIGKAITCYEQAIRIHNLVESKNGSNKRFHICHLNIATAMVETNNFLPAIEHLNYAIEDKHTTIIKQFKVKGLDTLVKHKNIENAIAAFENKQYDRAIVFLDQIYDFMIDNPVVNYYYAICCLKQGSLNQAYKYCDIVQKIVDKHPNKLVHKSIGEKIGFVLEQIKLQTQELLRNRQIMALQQRKNEGEEDSCEDDIEEGNQTSLNQRITHYNSNSNSHLKKKIQTEKYQDIFQKRNSSQNKSEQSNTGTKIKSMGSVQGNIINQRIGNSPVAMRNQTLQLYQKGNSANGPRGGGKNPVRQSMLVTVGKLPPLYPGEMGKTQETIKFKENQENQIQLRQPTKENPYYYQEQDQQSSDQIKDNSNSNNNILEDSYRKAISEEDFKDNQHFQGLNTKTLLHEYYQTTIRNKKNEPLSNQPSGQNTFDLSDHRKQQDVYNSSNLTIDASRININTRSPMPDVGGSSPHYDNKSDKSFAAIGNKQQNLFRIDYHNKQRPQAVNVDIAEDDFEDCEFKPDEESQYLSKKIQ